MNCLKREKAADPDGIMNDMLIYRDGWLVEVMLLMMNMVMKSECCPLDWKRSLLAPLHKDGDVEQVGNYRVIALGCCVGKVLVRVLERRLERFAEDRILTEAQGGVVGDTWISGWC